MRICVTGGAGYVGSALVPRLLEKGHEVTVLDTFWFGDTLPFDKSLRKITGDIRNKTHLKSAFDGQDAVIHLACVSNDPSFDMNPELGRSINFLCFKTILDVLKEKQVGKFIYASSSSVYGISELDQVTEASEKKPITDYSKFKLACEIELQTYGTGGSWTIVRPATVCGYAPRMRLDLVVNILTIQALLKRKITLFGRDQKRPNINIEDMVSAYEHILSCDERLVDSQVFNVGFENLSLYQIASLVRSALDNDEVEIEEHPTNDNRSYHVNSDKIRRLIGFEAKHTIDGAALSIKENVKKLKDPMFNTVYHNIKRMKELGL